MGKGNPYRWGSLPGAWGFGPDDNFVDKSVNGVNKPRFRMNRADGCGNPFGFCQYVLAPANAVQSE